MSVVTLMAAALDRELRERFNFALHRDSCEAIISAVIAGTAAVAHATESSHPAQAPGQALDGGCPTPADASAVAFCPSAMPALRTPNGGRDPSGDAPAVTPAQKAYALLWREMRVSDRPFVRETRKILLASLTPAEQAAAIAWVRQLHPISDSEIRSS
jgi:hypothetical protein